ncbi:hypothetical protein SAMN05660477_01114 [Soonwooa buanensis]|uniref:Uncharacterized protein n=1 Tax=Soonwooa buanensis TaxID=619805 RepID=A0A1T5E4R1_9FLAO|nr:hypothetical protein [Soonwooa buanensis]SKB78998.1 hypothetical protein SAMN05660477_01114 [Soonwooa buanensis]
MRTKLFTLCFGCSILIVSKAQTVVKKDFDNSKPKSHLMNIADIEKSFKTIYVIVQKDSVKQQNERKKQVALINKRLQKK